MTYFDYIIRLTCFQWRIMPMFPHNDTMKARLTYYNIVNLRNPRITPTGSRLVWWGYASKWAHPP